MLLYISLSVCVYVYVCAYLFEAGEAAGVFFSENPAGLRNETMSGDIFRVTNKD